MSDGLQDISEPPVPSGVLGADQAVAGPRIPPQQQILLYEAGQWEGFIHEWAHFSLKANSSVEHPRAMLETPTEHPLRG